MKIRILPKDKCFAISKVCGDYICDGLVTDPLFFLPDNVFGRECLVKAFVGCIEIFDPDDSELIWVVPAYFVEDLINS